MRVMGRQMEEQYRKIGREFKKAKREREKIETERKEKEKRKGNRNEMLEEWRELGRR